MSLVGHEVSPRQVAANQSNARKSTGPKTPDGKARVSLNALKTGFYAKGANALARNLAKEWRGPARAGTVGPGPDGVLTA